jgi:hypothetical protein
MAAKLKENDGIDLIVKKYRKKFQIPENINHYSEEDYKSAERKYLKYILKHGSTKSHL